MLKELFAFIQVMMPIPEKIWHERCNKRGGLKRKFSYLKESIIDFLWSINKTGMNLFSEVAAMQEYHYVNIDQTIGQQNL